MLLDVFADGGHDHARLRIGTTLVTAHLGETTGGYRLIALTGRCAELIRKGEQRTVCADEAHGPDAAPAR